MRQASRIPLLLAALTIIGVATSAIVLVGGLRASQSAASTLPNVTLPPGCVRPPGGFLIIQSEYGYNDSILEGAGPSKAWPVIDVAQGQTVDITVCNVDKTQAHGFEISNYFDSQVIAVDPGKVLHVPAFVADKTGTFQIYCEIFCTIHLFMQYGQLRVSS